MQLDRRNIYVCEKCGEHIVTLDIDEGVTPMFLLGCLATKGCDGFKMVSQMYPKRLAFKYKPSHVWYARKIKRNMDEGLKDHLRRGGLDIRPITTQEFDQWWYKDIPGLLNDEAESEEAHNT